MYKEDKSRIVDIARELGLSTATVSNCINGKRNKVSKQTYKRVWNLLEERDYFPGKADLLLGQNDRKIIGIFVDDHPKYEGKVLQDPFICAIVNALVYEIENNGYFNMLKLSTKVEDIIKFSTMWNMKGIVVVGFCAQDYQELREKMRIPFVIIDGECKQKGKFANIMIDNYDGGVKAGTCFKERGYKSIICISDNLENVDKLRIDGLKSVYQKARVILVPMKKKERETFYNANIDLFKDYDGIFCVSDFYALELMKILKQKKISKGIIGFDDVTLSEFMGLSTIRQNNTLRAKEALRLLNSLFNNEDIEHEVVLPVELIIRET